MLALVGAHMKARYLFGSSEVSTDAIVALRMLITSTIEYWTCRFDNSTFCLGFTIDLFKDPLKSHVLYRRPSDLHPYYSLRTA